LGGRGRGETKCDAILIEKKLKAKVILDKIYKVITFKKILKKFWSFSRDLFHKSD
jgi:hypothetical protein